MATPYRLEPLPHEGQGRTWLSRFFPSSELALARRAKYLDADDQDVYAQTTRVEPTKDGAQITMPMADPIAEKVVVEQVNGVYVEENSRVIPRTLGEVGAFWNMIAYSIALGIFSIPLVVATLGIVPFVLLSLLFGALTYYTGYQYWRLAMMYPNIHSLQEAGDLLFGRAGGIVFSVIQVVFGVFLQGNHALLGGYAFWYLGWRDCMVGMVAVFAAISFLFTLPRSYKLFAWQAAISFTSIFTVVIIAMIASGITGPQNKPVDAPPKELNAFGASDHIPHNFLAGVMMLTNLFVSFGASPAYLPVMAEMRERKNFPRSLGLLVAISTMLYLIVGGVINRNLGQYTKSPSLGSLTPTMIKVSYGLALPTIMVAGCASGQVSAKVLINNVFSGRRRALLKKPAALWVVWVVINAVTWTCAFVLAELIPFFGSFLGLEAALFWAFFLALAPVFHLWRHQYDYWSTWRNRMGFLAALGIIAIASFLCVAGLWSSVEGIRDQYNTGNVGSPFSCAMPN